MRLIIARGIFAGLDTRGVDIDRLVSDPTEFENMRPKQLGEMWNRFDKRWHGEGGNLTSALRSAYQDGYLGKLKSAPGASIEVGGSFLYARH